MTAYRSSCVIISPRILAHHAAASRRAAATSVSCELGRMRMALATSDCHCKSSVTSFRKARRSDLGSRRRYARVRVEIRISSALGAGSSASGSRLSCPVSSPIPPIVTKGRHQFPNRFRERPFTMSAEP